MREQRGGIPEGVRRKIGREEKAQNGRGRGGPVDRRWESGRPNVAMSSLMFSWAQTRQC